MNVHNCKQGTAEWLACRLGIPTASEFDALVTPKWKIKVGDGPQTYLCKKLCERWRRIPLTGFSGGAMEQGTIREEEAIPWLEFQLDTTIERPGFITSDDGRYGCSPDGLTVASCVRGMRNVGVEIKCPLPYTHVGYLLDGVLPEEYAAQVQGSMMVTGMGAWMFLSYCRGFPPLLLTVERDEKAIAVIREAVDGFNARLDAAYARLMELNGGPPKPMESTL